MNAKFGRHYLADLYLCQNNLWEIPYQLMAEVAKVIAVNNAHCMKWVFHKAEPSELLISGEFETVFVLIRVFPDHKFLALDLFSWNPNFDLENCSEGLIELFAPQVVAAEIRLRAEHLN